MNKTKEVGICYNCKRLGFDSCSDGYCSKTGNLVIDDRGCLVYLCSSFEPKETDKEEQENK